ncbi:MAG: hypothetical protein MUF49_00965 [Oculatellaceae cyanobacterium Prado106]|jgi:hypothetical protein|nr:hypothetical protein [Oculatellaceae cyanobacterium Prado106]
MIKAENFWRYFYTQWDRPQSDPIPGYSILILVPGDLPFFLKIALETCAAQQADHLVETLIIPDNCLSAGFTERLELWGKDYAASPLRLVPQKPLEKLFTRFHKNAHNNCWMQMVRGMNAVQTAHALWHDVDLFISESDFLKTHYETCVSQQYDCLGVSRAWDSWFVARGIEHIVGTWETMFDVSWVKQFQPWQHRGHDETVEGERHTFDISFWPQYQTPPEKVGRHQQEWGFIHFNYVTGTYRRFQQTQGAFEDDSFRMLLVRLLIDAYDPSDWPYEVPRLDQLVKGLTDAARRVTYLQPTTHLRYAQFRTKLHQLLESGLLSDERASAIANGVRPFDQALAWSGKAEVLREPSEVA